MGEAVASILVLDDDPEVRDRLARELTAQGFEAIAMPDPTQALALLKARRVDVAVVEYDLPGAHGAEFIQAVKQRDPGLEVIMTTRAASAESAVACIKSGAFDYVEKPLSAAKLWGLIDRALERRIFYDVTALTATNVELLTVQNDAQVIASILGVFSQLLPGVTHGLLIHGKDPLLPRIELAPGSLPVSDWALGILDQLAREAGGAARFSQLDGQQARTHGVLGLPREFEEFGVTAALTYPLVLNGVDLGVLFTLRSGDLPPFALSEFQKGRVYSDRIAPVLHNAKLYQCLLQAQQELQASETRLRQMFVASNLAILILDRHLIIQEINPTTERIFGFEGRTLLNQSLMTLFEPRQFEVILGMIEGTVDPGGVEMVLKRRDGDDLHAQVQVLGFDEPDGRVYFAIFRDMTEQRRMETELRHAQKLEAVGRLAAGIAHEINTPVQFVADSLYFLKEAFADLDRLQTVHEEAAHALTELLGDHPALSDCRQATEEADLEYLREELPRAFERAQEGLDRVASIVRAMKEFARPDRKEMVASDLNRGILSTIGVAQNEVKYVAEVETQLGELPPVVCHVGDLNQVFLNLLVNAAHAIEDRVKGTGQRGTIRIVTEQVGDEVMVAISDTGSGIPEEFRDKIFEPFFTSKELGRGTGQGLAIARNIVVDKHKGSLTFETELDRGTTFFIRLPVERKGAEKLEVTP
jgi:PAS domain S-box-containing protein